MNLAWEVFAFIVSTKDATENSTIIPYAIFAGIWAILDIFIFYTHLIIKENHQQKMRVHIIKCMAGVGLCFGVMFALYVQIVNPWGTNAGPLDNDPNYASFQWQAYTAFGDNVIMSLLFIYAIFWSNQKWKTQSLGIGLLKLFGTLNSSIVMGFFLFSEGKFEQFHFQAFPFVIGCGAIILVLDTIYCWLIYQKRLQNKLNIWIDWPKTNKQS
jgi:H+/Cl- antiporter ClcA